MTTPTCPRCLGPIPNRLDPGAYPGALSRVDNFTEVCSDCGLEEAVEILTADSVAMKLKWKEYVLVYIDRSNCCLSNDKR
jgi:hypothetical protein